MIELSANRMKPILAIKVAYLSASCSWIYPFFCTLNRLRIIYIFIYVYIKGIIEHFNAVTIEFTSKRWNEQIWNANALWAKKCKREIHHYNRVNIFFSLGNSQRKMFYLRLKWLNADNPKSEPKICIKLFVSF